MPRQVLILLALLVRWYKRTNTDTGGAAVHRDPRAYEHILPKPLSVY